MTTRKPAKRAVVVVPAAPPITLALEVRELILQAREGVARAVDSALTTLYWHVGLRVRQDILKEKRAGYGEKIVHALSALLVAEFGRGFAVRNLLHIKIDVASPWTSA